MPVVEPFTGRDLRGFLHRPEAARGPGLALTHGAGSDCRAPLLVATANAFAAAGFTVLRFDLPFRMTRAKGPPSPHGAAADRAGLRAAVAALHSAAPGPICLGGHSYGGRQATMLAADEPDLARALVLLSYPLHPPKKPDQLRTAHFPRLHTAATFVHGTTDGFGTVAELEAALQTIPAATRLIPVPGAGHDLKRGRFDWSPTVEAVMKALSAPAG